MKNTELFSFNFVDRTEERTALLKFLKRETPGNILWINGASGAGKTFFIENIVLEKKEKCDVIVYLNKVGEATATSYLTQFIKTLSEASHISFFEFVKTNYASIFDAVKKVAVNILTFNSINDFGFVENTLDLTKQFLTQSNERHHLVKVVGNYLKYVSRKKKALIILDNFTLCDEESLDIFSAVLHVHQEEHNLQFILVTTKEQLKKRPDILTLLSEKINVVRISLEAFSSSTYFFEILSNLFDLHQCEQDDICRLYQICGGLPQKLKIFLMNLYSQNGIDYQNEKAVFAYDKLRKLLQRELIDFDFDGLPKEQKYVLKLVTEWGLPIELTLLQDLIEYIANIDISLQEFTGSIFRKALLELENTGILEKTYERNLCQIKVKHDSIYYGVSQLLREDLVKSRFTHFCMLQFLNIKSDRISQKDWISLEAYHSFLAKTENWYQINVEYGLRLASEKQYIKAQKVLDRLSEHVQRLPLDQQLSIALNAYNAGEFERADSVLDLLQPGMCDPGEQFLLQTTRCRVAMMRLHVEKAINAINQLLDNGEALTIDQRLESLYLKEVALCLTPGGYKRAKRLFKDIVRRYSQEDSPFWMERIYRTAMDYYRGHYSKKYLRQAVEISRCLSDDEELAKATHNLGFEHFRCGEYREAMDCFEVCKHILENIKPHETSYCLNDIAAVHMAKMNYVQALKSLDEAAFWNRSDYAAVTIKGNKMMCHYFLNHTDEVKRLQEDLLRFVETAPFVDDKIYKKIYTNLAVVAMGRHKDAQAAEFLHQCIPYLKTETAHSSARVKKLLNDLGDEAGQVFCLRAYSDYYCDLPFEPWVLTFGNE